MTAPDPLLNAEDEPERARPLFSRGFWAAMAFTLLCVIAAVALVKLGPGLFPANRPPAANSARAAAAAAAPSIDQRLADIQARLQTQQTAAVSPPAGGADDLAALKTRVQRLEAGRHDLAQAAGAALAAAALSQAASSSRPFAGELAAMEAALPDSADLRALRPLAQAGAPTTAALAAEFSDAAARAAVASRARARGTGILARIAQAFAAIVTVRRVDRTEGGGIDAVLARAGRRVDDGDLEGALAELAVLPPAGQDALAGWRTRAGKRLEIDRRLASLRLQALAQLSRAERQEPAP